VIVGDCLRGVVGLFCVGWGLVVCCLPLCVQRNNKQLPLCVNIIPRRRGAQQQLGFHTYRAA
jgi:hypothetical protein